jgi:hypothetical protein
MWRFWIKTPANGELVIFDRSWYGLILDEVVNGLITNAELRRAVQDVLDFERTLADEGALIVKFFLHIHQDEQKLRFKKRLKNPETTWRVEPADWEQHAKYEQYSQAIVSLQKFTATDWAPWTIVPATDVRFAQLKIYETLIAALQGKLGVAERQPGTRPAPSPTSPDVEEANTPTPEYAPTVGPETSAADLEGVKIETEVVKQRQATSRRKKTAQPKEVPAEDPSATPGTNLP